MAKLVRESIMFEEQEKKDMDIHITQNEDFVTVFLDTANWDSNEEAYEAIHNLSPDILNQIEEQIYPPYKIDHNRLENLLPKIDYIDSYFDNGDEYEVWTMSLPIYEEGDKKKKKIKIL